MKTLEQVRMYSVPMRDPRVGELVTWYLETLQRVVDIIWGILGGDTCFQDWGGGWEVRGFCPYKVRVPELPKDRLFEKRLGRAVKGLSLS